MIYFQVDGKVRGKARPRVFYNNKMGRMQAINTQQTVIYENWIKTCFIQEYPKFTPTEQPLKLIMTAYFTRAKSNKMQYPTLKPDCDNIIKCIDALNGLAFKDDKQIVEIEFKKHWGERELLEIRLECI